MKIKGYPNNNYKYRFWSLFSNLFYKSLHTIFLHLNYSGQNEVKQENW